MANAGQASKAPAASQEWYDVDVAMLRLIAACPVRAIDQNMLVAVRAETTADRLVFVGQ